MREIVMWVLCNKFGAQLLGYSTVLTREGVRTNMGHINLF